ncbi:hypothetical protein PM082_010737 [Marasmius tenuissimus]|nr:hypothetical protein PM082_010737 [Marasmius tenuissimus]
MGSRCPVPLFFGVACSLRNAFCIWGMTVISSRCIRLKDLSPPTYSRQLLSSTLQTHTQWSRLTLLVYENMSRWSTFDNSPVDFRRCAEYNLWKPTGSGFNGSREARWRAAKCLDNHVTTRCGRLSSDSENISIR